MNIDDELVSRAKAYAARRDSTVDAALAEALQRMLDEAQDETAAVTLPNFSYVGGLQPGVDLYDRNTMAPLLGETSR